MFLFWIPFHGWSNFLKFSRSCLVRLCASLRGGGGHWSWQVNPFHCPRHVCKGTEVLPCWGAALDFSLAMPKPPSSLCLIPPSSPPLLHLPQHAPVSPQPSASLSPHCPSKPVCVPLACGTAYYFTQVPPYYCFLRSFSDPSTATRLVTRADSRHPHSRDATSAGSLHLHRIPRGRLHPSRLER